MNDDSSTNSDPPSRQASAFVSAGFERFCLWVLCGLSLAMAVAAIFSNEYVPRFNEQLKQLLQGEIVDHRELQGMEWFQGYQWFNRLEGLAWMVLAGLSSRRFTIWHKSAIEPLYSLAFLLFGLSDFIEAQQYPTWLGIWKVFNLLILLYCRSYLLRVHYRDAIVY